MNSNPFLYRAEGYTDLGETAFLSGHFDKAENYLLRAIRFYPIPRAKKLLVRVRTAKAQTTSSSSKKTPTESSDSEDVRKRKIPSQSRQHQPTEYTSEQLEAVQRIKKCKSYYEMLGVTKEATNSEIKKAYKNLALQLHPDKNHAPGATEAFKFIRIAFTLLTDPEKREEYDRHAEEPVHMHDTQQENFERKEFKCRTLEELINMYPDALGEMHHSRRWDQFSSSSNLVTDFLFMGVRLISWLGRVK